MSVQNHDQLRQYIAKRLGVAIVSALNGRVPFEQRRVFDRYQSVLFSLWLLAEPEARIREAWQAKGVRYNLLLKDFSDAPKWFAP